jgi:deoxyribose-phosphate aldolase
MTIPAIIEVILRTPDLENKRIHLAALVARDGHADAVKEVADFWRNAGGKVES